MKKKKVKKGFTLVELLAVIVILAIILVIAVPQIMSVIESARKGSIESTAKLIASSADREYTNRKILGKDTNVLCTDVASLNNSDYGSCSILFDNSGKSTVTITGKGKFEGYTCKGNSTNMECTKGEISASRKCTTTDTLVDNLKFVDGQYTYTYSENDDGWSVVLTDKSSTDPVTTELCGTINDKPIVSMKEMFCNSEATSIDVSSFDTSKVTNMSYMFGNMVAPSSLEPSTATNVPQVFSGNQGLEIKGLENFDTSNVTDMSHMFDYSTATTLDLSSFDTSNVTDMSYMFDYSAAANLDLSSFDTLKVTDMAYMFYGSAATEIKGLNKFNTSKVTNMNQMFSNSKATTLDLSSFDTSNVTNMSYMFSGSKAASLDLSSFDTSKVTNMNGMFNNSNATSLNLSSFDTSSVTNMSWMFYGSKAASLDLSSFDTSNVTNMSYMFWESAIKTGYARTQEDADRFNASSNKPSTLTFTVKS